MEKLLNKIKICFEVYYLNKILFIVNLLQAIIIIFLLILFFNNYIIIIKLGLIILIIFLFFILLKTYWTLSKEINSNKLINYGLYYIFISLIITNISLILFFYFRVIYE